MVKKNRDEILPKQVISERMKRRVKLEFRTDSLLLWFFHEYFRFFYNGERPRHSNKKPCQLTLLLWQHDHLSNRSKHILFSSLYLVSLVKAKQKVSVSPDTGDIIQPSQSSSFDKYSYHFLQEELQLLLSIRQSQKVEPL